MSLSLLSRSGFFANEACVSGGVVFAAATRNAASGHSACSIRSFDSFSSSGHSASPAK